MFYLRGTRKMFVCMCVMNKNFHISNCYLIENCCLDIFQINIVGYTIDIIGIIGFKYSANYRKNLQIRNIKSTCKISAIDF